MTAKIMEQPEIPITESPAPKADLLDPQKEIQRMVLEQLGKAKEFRLMRINHLFDDRYRINIYYDKPSETLILGDVEMRESFFITYDAKKNAIQHSSPKIVRRY